METCVVFLTSTKTTSLSSNLGCTPTCVAFSIIRTIQSWSLIMGSTMATLRRGRTTASQAADAESSLHGSHYPVARSQPAEDLGLFSLNGATTSPKRSVLWKCPTALPSTHSPRQAAHPNKQSSRHAGFSSIHDLSLCGIPWTLHDQYRCKSIRVRLCVDQQTSWITSTERQLSLEQVPWHRPNYACPSPRVHTFTDGTPCPR